MKYQQSIQPSRRELFSGLALLTVLAAVVMTRGTGNPRSASADVIVETIVPTVNQPAPGNFDQIESLESINHDDVTLEPSSDR